MSLVRLRDSALLVLVPWTVACLTWRTQGTSGIAQRVTDIRPASRLLVALLAHLLLGGGARLRTAAREQSGTGGVCKSKAALLHTSLALFRPAIAAHLNRAIKL